MKVVRVVPANVLWEFMVRNMPASLRAEKVPYGYGYVHCIYRQGTKRTFTQRIFEDIGDAVATVNENAIELFQPQYFSDFEDLCRKYENETGDATVELKYWECA